MEQVTLKRKILVHLLDYARLKEQVDSSPTGKYTLPFEISQEGIAEILNVRQAHISRALKELENDRLVIREKVYMRGANRMLTGYLLTWDGQQQAHDIKKKLDSAQVKFIDQNGTEKKITIKKLADEVAGHFKYIQIVDNISESDIFDIRKIDAKPTDAVAKRIDYAEKVVELKYFFGRKKELDEFKEWLGSPTYKMLIIRGIAGIGKTTLMSKLASDYKQDKNIFWYRVHEWSSLRNMLEHLSEFLTQLGKKLLSTYIASREILDIEELTGILEFQDLNAILIFEDYHKGKDELVLFLSALKESLENIDGTKIVVTSRYSVPFYDRRDVLVKKVVKEMELEGLDKESSMEVLKMKGLDETYWDKVYTLTRGHPLLLEIIKSVGDIDSGGDMKKFLQEEILTGLTEKEKNILYIASVFRYPFYPRAFYADEEIDYDTIDSLVEKSLLQAAGNTYDIHDVIKEFFYRRLTPIQRTANHAIAANYYLEEPGELANIEAQYHLLSTGEHKRASEIASQSGPDIIMKGYLEEFMSMLDQFEETKVNDDACWLNILTFKGDIYSIWGEWEMAIAKYQTALVYSKKVKDGMKTAELNRKLGNVYDKKGEIDKATEYYNFALKWVENSMNTIEAARILGGIGAVMMKQSKYKEAIDYLMKDFKVADTLGDLREKSVVFHNLGIVYFHTDQLDNALDYNMKCLKIMEELGDIWGIGTSYTNIANVYMKKEDLKNALEYNLKSLKVRQDSGDIWGISTCYNNIGNVYYRLRIADKAIEFYDKSKELFEKLYDERGVIATCNNLGLIWFEKGNMDKALGYYKHALDLLKTYGDERNIAATAGNLGMVYLAMGNTEQALECYQNSLKSFQKLKDKYCEAVSYNNMGNVYYQTEKFDESSNCYEKGYDLFKNLSDNQGSSTGLHNLGLVAMEKKEYKKAIEFFQNSYDLRVTLGDIHGQISSLNALALANCWENDVAKAKELGEKALALAGQYAMESVKAETMRTLSVIFAVSGDIKKGDEYFKKAITFFEKSTNDIEIARTYFDYGKELKKLKNRNAGRYLNSALNIYERLERKKEAEKVREIIG